MNANVKILRTKINNLSRVEINDWVKNILENFPEQKFVATLNPEIILKAYYNEEYHEILNSADLNICDGFGIKLVSWLKGKKIKARYTGVDLMDYLLKLAKEKDLKILVVVSKNSLSNPQEIEQGIKSKYKMIAQAKYFKENFLESDEIKKAEIIFVNFGAPQQEKFIFENRAKFPKAKILVGVGGAFDFLTGKIKRAPKWIRKIGFEWMWRLSQEPKRVKRVINAVIIFPCIFLINKKN